MTNSGRDEPGIRWETSLRPGCEPARSDWTAVGARTNRTRCEWRGRIWNGV